MKSSEYKKVEEFFPTVESLCEAIGIKPSTIKEMISYHIYCNPDDVNYDDVLGFSVTYTPLTKILERQIKEKELDNLTSM